MRQANSIGKRLLVILIFSLACGKENPSRGLPNGFDETVYGTDVIVVYGELGWFFDVDTTAFGSLALITSIQSPDAGGIFVNGVEMRQNIMGLFEPPVSLPYSDTVNISAYYDGRRFGARFRNVSLLRGVSSPDSVVEITVRQPLTISWQGERADSVTVSIQGYITASDIDRGQMILPGIIFSRPGEADVLIKRSVYKIIRANFIAPGYSDSTFVLTLSVANKLFRLKVVEGNGF